MTSPKSEKQQSQYQKLTEKETQPSENDNINPLVPGVHQLKAAGLFKYIWTFSQHRALKG